MLTHALRSWGEAWYADQTPWPQTTADLLAWLEDVDAHD
jgi:hypothetical protein